MVQKSFFSVLTGMMLLLLAGCGGNDTGAFQEAAEMIRSGKAECVLVREGKIICLERGKGVSPLLKLYDTHRAEMSGSTVVDKVIGRAAASVAICGKAAHVHGLVVSREAAAFLQQNGITCSWDLLVPQILNRRRDGLCPLEKSVEGCRDPEQALARLRKAIEGMRPSGKTQNPK